jgi:hypothetical protein
MTKLVIWYAVLFENDCGANGHVGDDEVPGVGRPALTLLQSTRGARFTRHDRERRRSASLPGAVRVGEQAGRRCRRRPVSDKHGQYVDESACDLSHL